MSGRRDSSTSSALLPTDGWAVRRAPYRLQVRPRTRTRVVRFWDQLPPAVILEAADRIFDHAKEEAGSGHALFNFVTNHASASFGSVYELRLFQLLPAIENLDPSKAEQLLRDNPKIKATLEQYPKGMRSLDGSLTSIPRRKAHLPTSSQSQVAQFPTPRNTSDRRKSKNR
jgi:hypothetical protein